MKEYINMKNKDNDDKLNNKLLHDKQYVNDPFLREFFQFMLSCFFLYV